MEQVIHLLERLPRALRDAKVREDQTQDGQAAKYEAHFRLQVCVFGIDEVGNGEVYGEAVWILVSTIYKAF